MSSERNPRGRLCERMYGNNRDGNALDLKQTTEFKVKDSIDNRTTINIYGISSNESQEPDLIENVIYFA